jgi:hypothetical protein
MIDGLNDTAADADALVRLLAGSGSHVNCIPMNPVAHTPWQASSADRMEAFAGRLRAAGIGVTIRRNRGQEVGAACGQLAAERSAEPTAVAVARRRERLVAASAAALARERSQEPAIAGLASASHAPPTDRVVARAGTPPTRVTGPGAPRPVTARTNAPRGTVGRGDAPRGTAPRPSEPRPTPRQDAIRSTRPQHPGTPRPGTTSRPASGRRPPGPPNRGGG